MNRAFSNTLLLVGLAAFAWGVRPVAASEDTPSTPAPATPAPAPVAPAVPPAETGDVTITSTTDMSQVVHDAMGKAGKVLQESNPLFRRFQYVSTGFRDSLSDKRVDVDLKDVSLRDALKRVLDAAGVTYQIDDDVSNDTKVTLKITHTALPVVLDLLTDANGVGWRTELLPMSVYLRATDAPKNDKPESAGKDTSFRVHIGKSVQPLPRSFRLGVLDVKGMPQGDVRIPLASAAPSAPGSSPYILHYRWSEHRAKFTCPNCHNKITIVQQPEEAVCSKCGRAFESDWKVCPFDGTKRPPRKDEWHYCPICGKAIKIEDLQTSWIVDPDSFRFAQQFEAAIDSEMSDSDVLYVYDPESGAITGDTTPVLQTIVVL